MAQDPTRQLLYVTDGVCAMTTAGYISASSSVHDLVHGDSDPGTKTPDGAPGGAGGARTRDRQIMRSTFVHSTSLTSNDALLRCRERTRGAGSFMGAGPRSGPRRALLGSYRRDAA